MKDKESLKSDNEPVAWLYKRRGGEILGQLVEVESQDLKDIRLGKCYETGERYLWPRDDYYGWQPLYTHADSGEVERWKASAEHFTSVSIKAIEDVARLRAKLAEQDTLLIERTKLLDILERAVADHDQCVASICEMDMDWLDDAREAIKKGP